MAAVVMDTPTQIYEKFPFEGAFGFYETKYLVNMLKTDRASFDTLMAFFKSFPGNTSISGSHSIDKLVEDKKLTL